MRRFPLYLLIGILAAASCSEAIRIDPGEPSVRCLAVDGQVTDQECRQVVRLSLTTDFFSPSTEIPRVSGATVSVSCGEQVYAFEEDPAEPGTYRSVTAFKGETGRTYRLDIDATVDGMASHYSAEDVIPTPGMQLDAVDYLYSTLLDNLWTLAIWGRDLPGISSRYLFQVGINGHFKPLDECFELPDDHYDGMPFSGFTMFPLRHTREKWEIYGDSFKPLERGDVITLRISALSEGYGEFLMKYNHLVFGTIPILTEQPANLQSNVTGASPVVGYFGACAVIEASCTVDDPYRKEYRPH